MGWRTGAFGEMPTHVVFLADLTADELSAAENLSYYSNEPILLQRVECGEGAVVGSVGSVDVVDVPSQRVECGEGAVVGSVGSVVAPSQRVECGAGAVVGSVGSVDVPSQRAECRVEW
jgi:hypothetical protein